MNGRMYLIDTSALARAGHAQVRYTIQTLLTDRVAATCVTVDLAAGYSGRTAADLAAIAARRRERYINLPMTDQIADRAREIQLQLSLQQQHRSVGVIDLITAAVAEFHDAALLHYDPSFELIASITGQAQLWVAPRGSLELADPQPPAAASAASPTPAPLLEPTPNGAGVAWPARSPASEIPTEAPYPTTDPLAETWSLPKPG